MKVYMVDVKDNAELGDLFKPGAMVRHKEILIRITSYVGCYMHIYSGKKVHRGNTIYFSHPI